MTPAERVRRDGFAFARAAETRGAALGGPGALPSDWEAFAASWDDLRPDEHMADGGRYRLRRHAVLAAAAGDADPVPLGRQPHYQGVEYNPLNGGVERWFEPVLPEALGSESLRRVLRFGLALSRELSPAPAWRVEVHQFRIEARGGASGRPTPEGVHRDGVDYALAMLVRRVNCAEGTTSVHSASGAALGAFTLSEPWDAAIVDDARVFHGVTPISALDPSKPGMRDVLVATFKRA